MKDLPALDINRAIIWAEEEQRIEHQVAEVRRRQDAALVAYRAKLASEAEEQAALVASEKADRERRRREWRALPIRTRMIKWPIRILTPIFGLLIGTVTLASLGILLLVLSLGDPFFAVSTLGGLGESRRGAP